MTMSYASKEEINYKRSQRERLGQRIAEIDAELAKVYDGLWQCAWGEIRRLEQLTDRRNSLELERNNKERELETYL